MKSNLLPVKLVFPNPQRGDHKDPPDLLLHMTIFDDLTMIAFGDPKIPKAPTIKITNDLKPKNHNEFEIELAVVLPDLLPNLGGKTEYLVDLANGELWVSNHMTSISYKDEDKVLTAILPRDAEPFDEKFREILKREPRKFLKTFVVWRGIVQGNDADSALEENIREIVNKGIDLINEYVIRLLTLEGKSGEYYGITMPVYDELYFDFAYLLIKGESNKSNFFRLALNAIKASLSPYNLKSFEKTIKWDDDIYKMFSIARTYIHGGVLDYGFLLLVITAELATARFVVEQLKKLGVSQNKIDDLEKSLTFNVMFNTHLPALTKGQEELEEELINTINEARKKRNDFMHEAHLGVDKKYLLKLRDSVMKYIDYLEKVRAGIK